MRSFVPLLLMLLTAASAFADAAVDQQIAGLKARDPAERLRATNALGRCGRRPVCAKAARALEQALFDPSPTVRRGALNALVALDARAAGGAIARLLAVERDASVVPAALLALGALQVQGHAAILVRAASHPLPAIRAAALTAAGSIGGARMRRLVLNSLQMAAAEDEQWLVRSSAVLALARLGKAEDLALIQRAFQEGGGKAHWMARAAVARAIASLHPHPRAALERMLLDSDPRVAVTAATGLARAGYTPLIREYLRHPKASVRMATVSAVRSVKLLDTRPRLHHMARFDASREVRFAAAVTLFQWGDPAADEMMLDAVRANDPAIWAEAVAQLARRTGARHGRKVKAWRRTLAQQRATGGAR